MNTKKMTVGSVATIMSMTLLAPAAFAAEGERGPKGQRGHGPQISEETKAELKAAFESNDYGEYVDIAEKNDFKRVMTEEQFDTKIEKHEQKTDAKEAIEDGDYSAWRAIVGDEKAVEVTSSNFYLLTDMHEARESGDEDDIADAKAALQDAGISGPGKKGNGKRGSRPERGEREGGERDGGLRGTDVDSLSNDEKLDLLEKMIEQIKARLGLS